MATDPPGPGGRRPRDEEPAPAGDSTWRSPTWVRDANSWPEPGDLAGLDLDAAAALLYEHFCEARRKGRDVGHDDYLGRFPDHASALRRLLQLHDAFDTADFRDWMSSADFPEAGDTLGPFELLRELGRGGFSRVFLAAKTDFDRKLFVLKVSRSPSRETHLLNRLQHPNVMPVLWSDTTPDGLLHVIGMPFQGGATLAAALGSLRDLAGRPRTGSDFLLAFDRVCAREFPNGEGRSGNRELLAGSTYSQAVAWTVARLADGLDHAARRGISHCDLKPSNVLLNVGLDPMLLDFNLAVGEVDPGGDEGPPAEFGGTLAYMAPERLEWVARGGSQAAAIGTHRADIYSLGLLLLESLTGSPPTVPERGGLNASELVGLLAEERRGLPASLHRRPIPRGLVAILLRCLDPDPGRRYAASSELAADLDNWRVGEPFRFTREPHTCVLRRRLARNRTGLVGLCATMLAAASLGCYADLRLRSSLRELATERLAAVLDRGDTGAFPTRRPGAFRVEDGADSAERAYWFLQQYRVLEPGDFRQHPEVISLDDADREELVAFLVDQTIRYALALQRRGLQADLPLARAALRKVASLVPSPVLVGLEGSLGGGRPDLLDVSDPQFLARWGADPSRTWLDAYLAGVVLEPERARQAGDCFERSTRIRPGFFWGQYRLSATAARLGEYERALEPLRYCLARRPENPVLHNHLGALLFFLRRPGSLDEIDRSLQLSPYYRYAFLNGTQVADFYGLTERSDRYAAGLLPDDILRWRVQWSRFHPPASGADAEGEGDLDRFLREKRVAVNRRNDSILLLTAEGYKHYRSGQFIKAEAALRAALLAEPGQLQAKYLRAAILIYWRTPGGEQELRDVVADNRVDELIPILPPGHADVMRLAVEEARSGSASTVHWRGLLEFLKESPQRLRPSR